jgi:hypothetical protein
MIPCVPSVFSCHLEACDAECIQHQESGVADRTRSPPNK